MRPAILLTGALALSAQKQEPPLQIPDSVAVERDLVYARHGSREMHLDLYLPKANTGPRPAVVYIHGGGWKNGNKAAFSRQAAHMAAKGMVGACIEYRLSGEAKWPAAIDDSEAAVRWLRDNAAKYNIDTARLGAAGGSAGGHLVALLGTRGAHVKAVAAFNPAVDLVSFGKQAPGNAQNSVAEFLGASYKDKPELWAEATPITHVKKNSAAFLFLHGNQDTTVPIKQSEDMLAKLRKAGVPAELFTAEGAAHGFFNRPPWFEPTLKAMEAFLLKNLAK
jgi:acetyl esterase/lipase